MKVVVEYYFPEITEDSSDRDKEIAIHNLRFDIESKTPSTYFSQYNYTFKILEPIYNA